MCALTIADFVINRVCDLTAAEFFIIRVCGIVAADFFYYSSRVHHRRRRFG